MIEYCGKDTNFNGFNITIMGGKKNIGKGIIIGEKCTIYDGCQLVSDDKSESGITIGNNCHLNFGCYICGIGGLDIGNNCLFGPGVKIIPANHKCDRIDIDIIKQGHDFSKVVINDNVWIGAGAIILAGVQINSGVVVAAGAVVTKNVESDRIVAGVPAKVIKLRGNNGDQ
ncbi:MAG: acyltransferase [Cyanobacteriota bacterium]|jgi:acetyltransferase-like isoleucine patch superfamily enzyme